MYNKKNNWFRANHSVFFFALIFLNNPINAAKQQAVNLFGNHAPDLVYINLLDELVVQVGDGESDFASPSVVDLNIGLKNMGFGDFNSDGLKDLVALDLGGDVALLLNNGVDGFLTETVLPLGLQLTENVLDLITTDLNGDGHQDIVVSISGLLNGRVAILFGDGMGGFDPHVDIELGLLTVATTSIHVSDLNADGKLDIGLKDILGTVHMILSDGLGGYSPPTSIAGLPLGEIQFSDFNHDGIPDLIVLDELLGLVTIRLGNGDGTFLSGVGVAVGLTPTDLVVVDLNLDGNRDLVTVNLGDEEIGVFIGDGLGGVLELVGGVLEDVIGIVPSLNTPVAIVSGDFNSDCRVDIAVWSDITQSFVIQLNQSGPDAADLIFCSVFEEL